MLNSNKIIIISGSSGVGKTTLINHLLSCEELNLKFSISACSRSKRDYEVDGKHYFFLPLHEFKKRIQANDFLEWEEVYEDHFYGTLKSKTLEILNSGKNILFDVDVYGALSIKKFFNHNAASIFIQTPSILIARERLISRGSDSVNEIDFRVNKMKHEISIGKEMDYQLVNDDLDLSKKKIYSLVNTFICS
ncbi:MAG: guanylate kinase [Flavobacteriales bacterium]|nr:guanylate kinase [Flavobacteriales bacterium]|tara:strand:- start:22 stop:597 length:576 start_codon:yes stop_codon:yes gene_type:complete